LTTPSTVTADPLAKLEEIRQRAEAAKPGPWRWRGNTDNGDPYLTSCGRVTGKDGSSHHAGDVLGHIPHEITREEARRWASTYFLPEPEVPAEPAATYSRRYDEAAQAQLEAEIDRHVTDKWGEPEKEPRLAFCTGWIYTEARELAVFEVAPMATTRSDPSVYRADITGIRHPDAEFIAHSREDIGRLLAAADAVLKLAAEFGGEVKALTAIGDDDYEPDTEDEPAWTARADAYRNAAIRIRSLIAAALSGEETPS
jgi:hypothetical protein